MVSGYLSSLQSFLWSSWGFVFSLNWFSLVSPIFSLARLFTGRTVKQLKNLSRIPHFSEP